MIDDTSVIGANEFRISCMTCKNSNTDYPEDADWWLKCKEGKQPKDNNVYNSCDIWEKHPIFNIAM